jgi:uncharacterized membrane protein YtjA (UPF0391 family)
MLRLALLFLIIALLAGLFGVYPVANMSFEAARLIFGLFIILAIIFFLASLFRGGSPAPPL